MKIRVDKALLSASMVRVQGALTDKNLAQVGIKAENNRITITAMDRHLAIFCEVDCDVEQPGTVFLEAGLFGEICRELPKGEVRIEVVQHFAIITAGQNDEFNMHLPLIDNLVWTDEPEVVSDSSVVLNADKLAYMINQVQFCVAMESAQVYGSVAYLHRNENGTLRLVGTDGFRLSFCDLQHPLPDQFLNQGICLSKRALSEFSKMCNEGFDTVSMSVSSDQSTLVLKVTGYHIYIRLSQVKYPNYLGVLPNEHPNKIEVSRSQMQAVTKRVMLSSDKTRAVKLKFASNCLVLSSKTLGGSESSEIVPIADYSGGEKFISVNGKFLNDVFGNTTSQGLQIDFGEQREPFVITPLKEPSECSSKHVLVPIHESQ